MEPFIQFGSNICMVTLTKCTLLQALDGLYYLHSVKGYNLCKNSVVVPVYPGRCFSDQLGSCVDISHICSRSLGFFFRNCGVLYQEKSIHLNETLILRCNVVSFNINTS